MKIFIITISIILFFLNTSVGYSQKLVCEKTGYMCPKIDFNVLIFRNGVFFKKFSDEPFTGKVTGEQQDFLKNGIKEGYWSRYYENGQLIDKIEYVNNKKNGPWINYYRNGNVFVKGNYKNNELHGEYFKYYTNGTLKEKGNYKNNELDGEYNKYYTNGTQKEKGIYNNGKLLEVFTYK